MNRLEKEAYELQEKDIEQYLNEALPELNLRLWIDMYGEEREDIKDIKTVDTNMSLLINEISQKNKILWLESITLTSYTPHDIWLNIKSGVQSSTQRDASGNTQNSSQSSTPHHNKRRIFNRLMGKLALNLPFTLKKYRKERR